MTPKFMQGQDLTARPKIAGFWFGSQLSWLEQLCIQSYLDQGHEFVLYARQDFANLPKGAELRDAEEIFWPPPFEIADGDRHRVAVFSDIFRLKMIRDTGFLYVDLDAYCVRAFDFATPYVFSISEVGLYPNGVIGLPQDSPALAGMIDFLTTPNPIQPWKDARFITNKERRSAKGERWGIEDLSWGNSGPKTFGHFLKETGEAVHAMPTEVFYPLAPKELGVLHQANVTARIERAGVHSVHIYGHQKKYIATALGGLPSAGSYLDMLCKRHGIDPNFAPIEILPWMRG